MGLKASTWWTARGLMSAELQQLRVSPWPDAAVSLDERGKQAPNQPRMLSHLAPADLPGALTAPRA